MSTVEVGGVPMNASTAPKLGQWFIPVFGSLGALKEQYPDAEWRDFELPVVQRVIRGGKADG